MPEKRLLEELHDKASASPRKRAGIMLNHPEADRQIMLNFFLKDSYLRPHRHNRPEQNGTITALLGNFSVLFFSDDGSIIENKKIKDSETVKIDSGVWHSVICLSDDGLLFETNGGVYDAATDKEFAPWAPEEDSPEGAEYLKKLRLQ